MSRRTIVVDTKSVAENSLKCESPMKTEIDGLSDREFIDQDISMEKVAQQERQALPGVTSLMGNHHLRQASLSSNVYSQELQEATQVKIMDLDSARIDESAQRFHTPDMKYLAIKADTEKTGFMSQEQVNSETYKERVNHSMQEHIVTPLKKTGTELISPETPLTIGALDDRAVSEHKLQLAFEDHRGFVNNSRMCYPGNLIEPLSPATAPSNTYLDATGNVLDRSPVNYSYQNYLSSWEQENNRFFNMTWRNDVYTEKAIACLNPGDIGSAKKLAKNNSIVNNINIDNCCFSKTFMTDSSCSSLGSNGRRRRRRVQTPVQRSAANMRERRRMCHLNVAFDRLKERLPNIKNKQKLSRIQTLKAAIDYINLLRDSLSVR
ncbi:unnamed protein product [Candidula unifasciata]|uniref:BHLH domain-containing protein n=1 Tax=Candidula unifasciata TaxID=100452 RepID=A0A8S3ZW14_9EUPU|nr:unnamed protein product [Candidula unifasciata]